jgi:heterotetrameric sarcosine oxidase delta subunit
MRIACPHCGERGLDEFSYFGDASITRPDPALPTSSEAFQAFGYDRRNLAGIMEELWYHASGCHAWLVVTRDTRTHKIHTVRLAQEVALGRKNASAGGPA